MLTYEMDVIEDDTLQEVEVFAKKVELLKKNKEKHRKHFERLPSASSDSEVDTSPVFRINKHLFSMDDDYLHHISLGKSSNLRKMFGDVKFICMGGSAKRMHKFALYIKDVIGYELPAGMTFQDISEASDRYSMYKVGPILSVNHGMGCPSMSILLHELIKLVHYAKCEDVTFFRMGTSGGLGVKPGTVIVTSEAVDGMFRPEYRTIILGKEVIRETTCNQELVERMLAIGKEFENKDGIELVTSGKTMCAHDFYEGQGRLDGAFCEYNMEQKMQFLQQCKEHGVSNIEMESLCFTGLLNRAKLRGVVVCVTILDRLNGDQVDLPHHVNLEYQERPFKLVGHYIKQQLEKGKISV